MRSGLFLLMGLLFPTFLLGQNPYRLVGHLENGRIIQENEVFYLNSMGVFNMVDTQNETITFDSCCWSVEALNESGNKRTLMSDNVTKDFTLDFNTETFNTAHLIGLQRVSCQNDVNVYHMVKIICRGQSGNNEIADTLNIRLNILPARPQLKIFDFSSEQGIGQVEFKIEQKRQNKGIFIETIYDEYGALSTTSYPLDELSENLSFQLLINYPMFNTYAEYKVYSYNDFGMVESDILKLDDDIIKDLTPSKDGEIKSHTDITVFPNPTDGVLSIATERQDIKKLFIFNQYGQFMKTIDELCNMNTIDVSNLSSGHYFIGLVTAQNKLVKTIKIFKH